MFCKCTNKGENTAGSDLQFDEATQNQFKVGADRHVHLYPTALSPFADLICARRLPFAALRLFDQSRRAGLILPGNFEIDALTACCTGDLVRQGSLA